MKTLSYQDNDIKSHRFSSGGRGPSPTGVKGIVYLHGTHTRVRPYREMGTFSRADMESAPTVKIFLFRFSSSGAPAKEMKCRKARRNFGV